MPGHKTKTTGNCINPSSQLTYKHDAYNNYLVIIMLIPNKRFFSGLALSLHHLPSCKVALCLLNDDGVWGWRRSSRWKCRWRHNGMLSFLDVIWGIEIWKHCAFGYMGVIRMLWWEFELYGMFPKKKWNISKFTDVHVVLKFCLMNL